MVLFFPSFTFILYIYVYNLYFYIYNLFDSILKKFFFLCSFFQLSFTFFYSSQIFCPMKYEFHPWVWVVQTRIQYVIDHGSSQLPILSSSYQLLFYFLFADVESVICVHFPSCQPESLAPMNFCSCTKKTQKIFYLTFDFKMWGSGLSTPSHFF